MIYQSLIKSITPPIAWSFARAIRAKCIGNDLPSQDRGVYESEHGCFYFGNSGSFQFSYNEYFQIQKYKFHTENNKPLIIDGGANIGVGCRYWKFLYPQAEVLAFEPDDKNYALLEKNMAGIPGFKAEKKALWSSHGTLKFNPVGGEGGYVSVANPSASDHGVLDVPAFRLRDVLDRKIDLLKLDIEGGELEVLRDCKNSLGNVERIFVEHHSFLSAPQHLGEFFGILENAGFRLNIQVDIPAKQPFLKRIVYNAKDSWINIFGYRK
jgi:FkbM family methyltransferase